MSLIEALASPPQPSKKTVCRLEEILQAVRSEERIILSNAMLLVGDPSYREYSTTWLAVVLTENGYPVSASTTRRHTNRKCCCFVK